MVFLRGAINKKNSLIDDNVQIRPLTHPPPLIWTNLIKTNMMGLRDPPSL